MRELGSISKDTYRQNNYNPGDVPMYQTFITIKSDLMKQKHSICRTELATCICWGNVFPALPTSSHGKGSDGGEGRDVLPWHVTHQPISLHFFMAIRPGISEVHPTEQQQQQQKTANNLWWRPNKCLLSFAFVIYFFYFFSKLGVFLNFF